MRSIRLPMNPLDFDQLTELGRSIIPASAPKWTDYNTHDPGIMILELLSWIAEAQMYSISRTRKDERLAFARLLGLTPRGPLPATGLVWASPDGSPVPWAAGHVVKQGTAVTPDLSEPPQFFTTASVELTTARLKTVSTRFHDGQTRDWTAANTHDGATFMPFGTSPGPGDRLLLAFKGPLVGDASREAVISIGVHIATDEAAPENEAVDRAPGRGLARLAAALRTEDGERPLRILSDTTDGFLRTGLLLVRIPAGAVGASQQAVIVLRSATGGFMRAPRFQQISPNVLPIEQVEQVPRPAEERRSGNGLPDQVYVLQHQGLIFPFDGRPFIVTVVDASGPEPWRPEKDFGTSGPDDPHYVLDEISGTLRFGNGINGKIVPAGASINVTYSVSQGLRGNQPANLPWIVTGIAGPFGTNVVPIAGGADARGLPDLRRLARQRIKDARPVVTSADLVSAARAFTDLGITRALELTPHAACRVRGTRILLIVGPHDEDDESTREESAELLSEIHARIAPRLALGQTLDVIAPRYVTVRMRASIVAAPRVDPDELRKKIVDAFRTRLAIVPREAGKGWPFGRDLTATSVSGWLRRVEGVASVGAVTLSSDPPSTSDSTIALGRTALPILDVRNSEIAIERSIHRSLQRPHAEAKR